MSEHHRTTLNATGEMVGDLHDPSAIPAQGSRAGGTGRAGEVSNATKARLIVLLAVLAIALSAFAVFRVVSRSGDEGPDAEAAARAAAIEMQMSVNQPPPQDSGAPLVSPADRRRGASRVPNR